MAKKKIKKQKQKIVKLKQEQTVIVNVGTNPRRQRTNTPVSKQKEISPLAVQNTTNIQLLEKLSNLFASQKKPEFERILSTEPIMSQPLSNSLKDVIEIAKKSSVHLEDENFAPIEIEKSQPISMLTKSKAESFEPPKMLSSANIYSTLYTKTGKLDKRSKSFKNLSQEEKTALIIEERKNKSMEDLMAKQLKKEERQLKKEEKEQEKEKKKNEQLKLGTAKKKLDLIIKEDSGEEADMESNKVTKILNSQKLHNTTRMIPQPVLKPFQGVNALNSSEEEK